VVSEMPGFCPPTPPLQGTLTANPLDPKSWNRYVYAGNDPIDFSDPTGLKSGCDNWFAKGLRTRSFIPSSGKFPVGTLAGGLWLGGKCYAKGLVGGALPAGAAVVAKLFGIFQIGITAFDAGCRIGPYIWGQE